MKGLNRELLLGGAVGALLAFLFDPDQGNRRRKVGWDRLAGVFRRFGGRAGRFGRHVASDVQGAAERASRSGARTAEPVDDATLAQRVQSELFRETHVPKGRINVNVEHGVVVLRGELDQVDQIAALVEEAGKIPGVVGVENLLHVTGSPAPGAFGEGFQS